MIQLSSVLYLTILTFALIGFLRGFDKELVATSGIVLAIFTLVQFNDFFTTLTTGTGNPQSTLFHIQAAVLLIVTFFAYQTPAGKFATLTGGRRSRDRFQTRLLGTLTGGFNGYLVFGTLWNFLENTGYPIGAITPPLANSASASLAGSLPLTWLLQGNLLTLFVIGLFLFILIAII